MDKLEKLLSLLRTIYYSESNILYYEYSIASIKRISILICLKDNQCVNLNDDFNLEDIKSINVKNQITNKSLIFLAKDIKSCSIKDDKLFINRKCLKIK